MKRILLTGLLLSGFACAHGRGAAEDQGELPPDATPVTVNVTNNFETSMEIYAIGGGTSYRMGSVAPGIPRRFELRSVMIAAGGRVRFLAQASGTGPRVQSEELLLVPGDIVDFEIMTGLVGSRATVRP